MRIKIGDNFYDSESYPIMVMFTAEEKSLVADMAEDNFNFCSFPNDGYSEEDILKFMRS